MSLRKNGWLLLSFALFAAVGQAKPVFAAERAKSDQQPNIIYILADDLGYGDVQCLNPQRGKIPTPQLDRMAKQGMTFTEAHSGSSVCTPTRYGVLTGRYAWRSHLQEGVISDYVTPLIAPDRLTIADFLKQQGYNTACIGKWHLGFTIEGADDGKGKAKKEKGGEKLVGAPLGSITRDGPVTRGFDHYFGFHHARMMKSIFENDRVTQMIEPIDILPALVQHTKDHIAARAKNGQPFFIYLALNSPHTPIVPSKEWQGKSGIGDYGDFVMETDWAVGAMLTALDNAGISDNTLVIFTSDNGCSPAANTEKLEKDGHFASADRRGYKADIWDGGHRVPFIVRWPARIAVGKINNQLICHTDFMATCADLLGVKLPDHAGEDSVSILPALLGTDKEPIHEAVVHHSISGKFAIRQGNWKLELCPGSGGWGKPSDAAAKNEGLPDVQLYDLGSDIAESKNVQAEHPEIVKNLTALLEQYVANGRSTPGPKQTNDTRVLTIKSNKEAKRE